MSKNGVQVLPTKKKSPSAIVVKSLTTIGIVSTAVKEDLTAEVKTKLEENGGLLVYSSAKDALKDFAKIGGKLREDLYDISAQNVASPIVVSLVQITEAQAKKKAKTFHDDAKIKSAIVKGIQSLRLARTVFGSTYKVRISISPWYSHDDTVVNALKSLNTDTKTISVVDLDETSVTSGVKAYDKLGLYEMTNDPHLKKK